MFYEHVKQLCSERGEKITTVTVELGYSKGTLSNWKNGGSPSADVVVKFAEYFGVSTDRLLVGEESFITKLFTGKIEGFNPAKKIKDVDWFSALIYVMGFVVIADSDRQYILTDLKNDESYPITEAQYLLLKKNVKTFTLSSIEKLIEEVSETNTMIDKIAKLERENAALKAALEQENESDRLSKEAIKSAGKIT